MRPFSQRPLLWSEVAKPLETKQGRLGGQKISAIFAVDVVGPVVLKSL
jgi:hypothetical protein